jgi:hypothetical protein|tara:strand:+ start:651 stop:1052 length:402 start_codon:yes stop_codon:yes gene_type:complete
LIKDIDFPEIKGVSIAIVHSRVDDNDHWMVTVINENKFPIENLMVVSKGYGTVKDEQVKTSTLRRSFETVPANGTQQVEPIIEEVFGLTNEYWLSFYTKEKLFDKKFVFTAGSISKQFLVNIAILNEQGILHP